jgi:hypothetical protein
MPQFLEVSVEFRHCRALDAQAMEIEPREKL